MTQGVCLRYSAVHRLVGAGDTRCPSIWWFCRCDPVHKRDDFPYWSRRFLLSKATRPSQRVAGAQSMSLEHERFSCTYRFKRNIKYYSPNCWSIKPTKTINDVRSGFYSFAFRATHPNLKLTDSHLLPIQQWSLVRGRGSVDFSATTFTGIGWLLRH